MKVFVWESVEEVTNSYHSDGGIVVFAETLERAKALALLEGAKIRDDEEPDDVREVQGGEEKVYIMPNAGCC